MAKHIVVCGGNGFLGSRICRAAASRNWRITSLSRSGIPTWSSITSSPDEPSWAKAINWQKADLLDPGTYRQYLSSSPTDPSSTSTSSSTHPPSHTTNSAVQEQSSNGPDKGLGKVDAVIHSMGILLEADYKGVLSGEADTIPGIMRVFQTFKEGAWSLDGGARNPLKRKQPGTKGAERLESGEEDGQVTYELMNRDSAIVLAREANNVNIPTFVYISAAGGAPLLPRRYIRSKREAESSIASKFPKLRSIFIRPGFLYDTSRKFTMPIAWAGEVGSMVNWVLGGRLSGIFKGSFAGAVEKPLKADLVAEAVVEAIEKADVKGVVDTAKIEGLAGEGWRRGML